MKKNFFLFLSFFCFSALSSQGIFEQLGTELPTPNSYRSASGAPGPEYWQQKADYIIKVVLDDEKQTLTGEETITYKNNSPDILTYLWLQLDQNMMALTSNTGLVSQSTMGNRTPTASSVQTVPGFDGGYRITSVTNTLGKDLPHTINQTMMRIDIPAPLKTGESYSFKIKYWYNINDRLKVGGRSGYEYFAKDDNYLYTIAQFFPRMCVYDDVTGWQNKQFLGSGEFALTFGDYEVEITVPADHLVAATGTLKNDKEVLTKDQISRMERAKKETTTPVIIASQAEAEARELLRSDKVKTWKFSAKNVRDFAFASSRKFIWDAMAVNQNGNTIMAMSMYPKEGNPLWEKYSTKAVAHTLKWYSEYTFDYPYPVAWSINADKIGMEYPMICFNFGRTEPDGTYAESVKYGMISVIIHEVGHNYFPMIVNSDERQWTWMDEGLNSYLQYLAEQQWQRDYPSRRGPAPNIVPYMSSPSDQMVPIMTNSEQILQFGNNAYGKPATALNILRETVMGRELFDFAFKEYSNRWKFKHPAPADFFRTMEDASGVDLDWFWRAWFYTTLPVDISLKNFTAFKADPVDPEIKYSMTKEKREETEKYITDIKNQTAIEKTYNEIDTSINDFYNFFDKDKPTVEEISQYEKLLSSLSEEDKKFVSSAPTFYEFEFENVGGNPMPVIFELKYSDGTSEVIRIPAEIWRKGDKSVKKVFQREKTVVEVVLDPYLETADINRDNNYFPKRNEPTRFELFKSNTPRPGENPMQKSNRLNPSSQP